MIPCPVVVAALESMAGAPEQERAGSHQFAAAMRTVFECSAGNHGDRYARMLLFERAIPRTEGAHDLGNGPARSSSEGARPRAALFPPIRNDRNFRQEMPGPFALEHQYDC